MIYPDGKDYAYPPTDGTVNVSYSGVPYTYSEANCGWFDVNLSGPFHWKRDPNRIAFTCIGSDPDAVAASSLKINAGGTVSINLNPMSDQSIFIDRRGAEPTKHTLKCECGAHKIKSTKHYSWCCLYAENR